VKDAWQERQGTVIFAGVSEVSVATWLKVPLPWINEMKKSLLGLVPLAIAGSALAQSSVTLFGVVDAGISVINNKSQDRRRPTFADPLYVNRGSVTVSKTELQPSGYNTSRIGFRGTEDLGGGLAASFWLESPLANDDGSSAITFSRRSTVSLSGGFGEVRLGRDYTPSFWNDAIYDPFAVGGIGVNLIISALLINPAGGATGFGGNTTPIRASNSIGYFLPPNIGGFYGQVMYGFNEQTKYAPAATSPTAANTSRAGRYIGGRFGYAKGPLDLSVAYGDQTTGDQYFQGVTDYVKTANAGVSYDFGSIKVMGEISRSKNTRSYSAPTASPAPDVDLNGYLIGFTLPIGASQIVASYARMKYDRNTPLIPGHGDASTQKLALGYIYNLSKRTALYAVLARVNNRNGAAVQVLSAGGAGYVTNGVFTPRSSTGYDFGIRHAF
jgi:predicted porin